MMRAKRTSGELPLSLIAHLPQNVTNHDREEPLNVLEMRQKLHTKINSLDSIDND